MKLTQNGEFVNYFDNLIFTINVIFPLVALMAVGFGAKHLKKVSKDTVSQCNSLMFKLFLPILLFNNVRNTSLDSIMNFEVFGFVLVFVTLSFIITTIIIMKVEKDNSKRGVMIQGICRSNYALFGLPLIELLHPGQDLGIAAALVAIVIPIYNIYSVIILTVFNGGEIKIKKILKNLVSNTLIIGTLCGVIVLLLGVKMPQMLDSTFNNFAVIATPLALFMLGASFDMSRVKKIGKQLAIICAGRLVILPTIVVGIAILMGFRGIELTCLMVIFYSPTAASSYVMAVEMGGDGDLAAGTVVMTTMLCVVSMFVVIYTFNGFGLL